MGCLRASAIAMTIVVALLLLVTLTDARRFDRERGGRGGGKHHRFGMDDCGWNRTCRELSRECKKMFFASMIDDYIDSGDDEIVTTLEKMAAKMAMIMERQQNLTICANETRIELPNSANKNFMTKSGNDDGSNGGRPRGGWPYTRRGMRGGKAIFSNQREDRDFSFGRERKGAGGGGKWRTGNFGVSEEDAIDLKKCLLRKKELLSSNDTLDRKAFKAQISTAYESEPDVQTAVEKAVDSCPEPEDYNIHGFIKCINKACIDNLELDDGEDSPQGNKRIHGNYNF